MRIACIIMAHREPRQIERFIRKFTGFPFDFFIHLDKKITIAGYETLSSLPNVRFIKERTDIRWASYSFVRAELQSIKEIIDTGLPYDFISVMSGQDYPLRPMAEFYDFLSKNIGKNFMAFENDGRWWKHAISRIRNYHFTDFGFRGRYRIQFLLNALLPARKFPLPYTLYGGPRAMCMTLSVDCARYVLEFIESNKKLQRFLRFTWGPDEFIFPTLIMNSSFRETVVNDNLYFIDWSAGGANPKTFTISDFESMYTSGKMFARKFDIQIDSGILDKLDEVTS